MHTHIQSCQPSIRYIHDTEVKEFVVVVVSFYFSHIISRYIIIKLIYTVSVLRISDTLSQVCVLHFVCLCYLSFHLFHPPSPHHFQNAIFCWSYFSNCVRLMALGSIPTKHKRKTERYTNIQRIIRNATRKYSIIDGL